MNHVEAANFNRFMSTGRTSPALMGCEDVAGVLAPYVVKLNASVLTAGTVKEFAASALADHFGIAHPPAAFVTISLDFADAVALLLNAEKSALIRNSVGINFGSLKINNLATWPVDRKPTAAQENAAVSIFAFDVLIQNPDRRVTNPNLATVGDELRVFDHELAFGFLEPVSRIFAPPEQWRATRQIWLDDHALRRVLPKEGSAFQEFADRLRTLPANFLSDQLVGAPSDWHGAGIEEIETYLNEVQNHTEEFVEEIVRRLA